jgi:hypothetical protein
VSQSNEKTDISEDEFPDDDDEFMQLIAGIEGTGDALATLKQAKVDSESGDQTKPVDPDLITARVFLDDLRAGRVEPPKEFVACPTHGQKILVN